MQECQPMQSLNVSRFFSMSTRLMAIGLVYFISTPFFSAQPGVAYREAVFEPQVCLDVCLANQSIFIYEITIKVVLITVKLCSAYN